MKLSKDQHIYFVNHHNRTSTWDDPRDSPWLLDSAGLSTNLKRLSVSSPQPSLRTPSRRNSSASRHSRHSSRGSPITGRTPKKEKTEDDVYDSSLKASLKAAMITESTKVRWNDIAGLEEAKHALQGAVLLPIRYPEAFPSSGRNQRGILLYGPPGTGKSLLAKALAAEAGFTFFSVSSSDVESKWIGESQRKVRLLFELARENRPAIIFIDEIDSICSTRNSDSSDHRSGMKTELLVQMDGVGKDNKDVFVLAATNVPWRLDTALLSRLQRKIYIPLPDGSARRLQLQKSTMFTLSSEDLEFVAKQTRGLSGRDIDVLLHEAFETAKTRILKSQYFCKVKGTNPSDLYLY
jgi:vacuolar protein-sorting-associated protein 4